MDYQEMKDTLSSVASLMSNAEEVARKAITSIAVGRLRHMDLPHWALANLKRELKNYDIIKGRWK